MDCIEDKILMLRVKIRKKEEEIARARGAIERAQVRINDLEFEKQFGKKVKSFKGKQPENFQKKPEKIQKETMELPVEDAATKKGIFENLFD